MEDYVEEGVLDQSTLKTLYKLSGRGAFSALGGVLNTGKEADVFYAERDDEEVAIKIYRTATGRFKEMRQHMAVDPRVRGLGSSTRSVVYKWTQREFGNLRRASEAVRVPEPYDIEKNVIVMEFIGEDGVRAPSLRTMEFDDWDYVADLTIGMMADLYGAGLIHGDFSEYNVLVMGELVLIDLGQAVTPNHPLAEPFLKRDVANVVKFFRGKGVELDRDEVMQRIRGAS